VAQSAPINTYQEDFRRLLSRSPGAKSWLSELKAQAMERFVELGFPSSREEEWRFTNVEPLAQTSFSLATPGASLSAADLDRMVGSDYQPRLVMVDGVYSPSLSRVSGLPADVRVESLAATLDRAPDRLADHLGRYAKLDHSAFTALSTAFVRDGALVQIGAGVEWDRPIQIVFATSGVDRAVTYPRSLIIVGDRARAVVQEIYVGRGRGYFTNAVTELVVGGGGRLDHCRIQMESEDAFHIATTRSHQDRDSTLDSCSVVFGSGLARHDLGAVLDGSGAFLSLNGLSVLRGRQHADHHTLIDHAQPHCESHELFNGVFDEGSRGVFNGRIIVRPGAQRTDSKQTNNNLLLSRDARADSQPQLEIYADDVKCTHGATLGPLDDLSMFYLRSRGLGPTEARQLLTYGFGAEIVGRIRIPGVRDQLQKLLVGRLGQLPMGRGQGSNQ
jgi:Fe-S cluster assembly protein SufD